MKNVVKVVGTTSSESFVFSYCKNLLIVVSHSQTDNKNFLCSTNAWF